MRITIDEQARLVHVSGGAALLTLEFPRALELAELEAAADGLRAALVHARVVVINGEAIDLDDAAKAR